jgi:hypothetical protein
VVSSAEHKSKEKVRIVATGEVNKDGKVFTEQIRRVFLLVPAQVFVGKWISSFKDFPPRQKPASFSVDEVMKKLEEGSRGK